MNKDGTVTHGNVLIERKSIRFACITPFILKFTDFEYLLAFGELTFVRGITSTRITSV